MKTNRELAGIKAYAEFSWMLGVYQIALYQYFTNGSCAFSRIDATYPAELRLEAEAHAAALTTAGVVR